MAQDTQNGKTFFDELTDEPIDHSPERVRALAEKYAQKSKIIRDVLDGRDTFEVAVQPLLEENLRLKIIGYDRNACNTARFEGIADEAREKFKKALPLHTYTWWDRRVDLCVRCDFLFFHPGNLHGILRPGFIVLLAIASWQFITSPLIFLLGLKTWFLLGVCLLGIAFLSIVYVFVIYPILDIAMYILHRRDLARKTLVNARFLDACIRKLKE